MKYCDFHCDALNPEGALQVTGENLRRGGCLLQTFAAFISPLQDRFAFALSLCDKFDGLCEKEGYHPVRRFSDIEAGECNALLAVEDGGALEGSLDNLETLYERGVRLITLTWNRANELGYPAFPDYEGLLKGSVSFAAREKVRGLTPFGKEVVSRMGELGMLVDVSHGSDALFSDVAEMSKIAGRPFVASHSAAAEVHACARNLTDEQIRTLAGLGGAVGLYFCADFLGNDASAEGQRQAILSHARHIVKVGGEDVLCFGSDFDGIPENAYIKNPAGMPALMKELEREFGGRVAEKIASGNLLRVLKETLPS